MEKMKKVLIVDDSPFSRNILKKILKTLGPEILEAGEGDEAIKVFEAEKPDLVILDLLMPGQDGLQILQRLKGIDPKVKALICSADKQSFRKTEALEMGAASFVNKPVDPALLLKEAGRYL